MIQTLEVQNLSCGACAVTIRTGLDNEGFTSVKVNLRSTPHTVTAEIENDDRLELFKKVLRDHGYPLIDDEVIEADMSKINFA